MKRALACLTLLVASGAAQPSAEPQPVVAGRAVDPRGQPLPKVALTLDPLAANTVGDRLAPYGVTSDNSGVFEFYGVPPGRYRLTAERAGYLNAVYGARNSWAAGAVLTLRASAQLTGLTIRLVEHATLSGKVVTQEDAASWMVELYQQQYRNGRRQWVCVDAMNTPSSGEFSFRGLKAGRYRLGAVSSGRFTPMTDTSGRYIATYYPGVTELAQAETIELRAGQTLSDMRLPRLKAPFPANAVTGSIVRKAGSSATPMAYLWTDGWEQPARLNLTKDRFQQDQMDAGSYVVGVLEGERMGWRLVAHQTVQVSGEVQAPTLDLDAIGLRGTVQFDRGGPGGVKPRVKLIPEEDPLTYYAYADAAADGTFALRGSFSGAYRIEVEGLPVGAYVKSAAYGGKDALRGLDLTLKSEGRLAIVIGAAGAQIYGAVTDEHGKPVDGTVILVPDPPQPRRVSLYRLAETGENGRFEFQGVPPGKYRLYAWEEFEPGAQFDASVTAPLQSCSVAVTVAEGERKEISLPRISADAADTARNAP